MSTSAGVVCFGKPLALLRPAAVQPADSPTLTCPPPDRSREVAATESAGTQFRRLVVIPAGEDSNLVLLHLVDEPVFPINPPGPASFEFMPQGLRFSGPAERLPLNIPDQANRSEDCSALKQ